MKRLLLVLAISILALLGSVAHAQVMEVSAYTHTGGVMANGEYPYVGAVASDDLPGREYVVADRFGGGHSGAIDIFVDTYEEAIEFGRQWLDVIVL